MLYGIPQVSDPAIAYLSAITYWIFSCRDAKRSPAQGITTWSYLQKAIENSAIPAKTLDQYQSYLCDRLVVPALYPRRLTKILSNPDSGNVLLVGRREQGTVTDLREITPEAGEILITPDVLLQDLKLQGISERQILQIAKPTRLGGMPHIIGMYCQVAHEVYKYKPQDPEDETTIEVEADAA